MQWNRLHSLEWCHFKAIKSLKFLVNIAYRNSRLKWHPVLQTSLYKNYNISRINAFFKINLLCVTSTAHRILK